MVYKFSDKGNQTILEIHPYHDKGCEFISIDEKGEWNSLHVELEKGDIYKLIGALHLIHKNMK